MDKALELTRNNLEEAIQLVLEANRLLAQESLCGGTPAAAAPVGETA